MSVGVKRLEEKGVTRTSQGGEFQPSRLENSDLHRLSKRFEQGPRHRTRGGDGDVSYRGSPPLVVALGAARPVSVLRQRDDAQGLLAEVGVERVEQLANAVEVSTCPAASVPGGDQDEEVSRGELDRSSVGEVVSLLPQELC